MTVVLLLDNFFPDGMNCHSRRLLKLARYWNLSLFSSLGKSQFWLWVEQQSSFLHLDNFHCLRGRLVSRTSIHLSHQACLEAFWDWPKKKFGASLSVNHLQNKNHIWRYYVHFPRLLCVISSRPNQMKQIQCRYCGKDTNPSFISRDNCFLWICQFYWKVFPVALRVISFPVLVLILVLIWINGWKTVDQKLAVL